MSASSSPRSPLPELLRLGRPGSLVPAFPPIGEYSFLSDCENTCLISPTGSVEWLCLTRPHDPSVFGTILDRTAGSFRLAPSDSAVPAQRHYVPGTMAMTTTWRTRGGWLEVVDFLAVGPWSDGAERPGDFRRPPVDSRARHLLVRTATCLHGSVDVALSCEPSFDYGREDARWRYAGDDYSSVATVNEEWPRLALSSDLRLGVEGRAVRARHRLAEGESIFVAFDWSGREESITRADVDRYWAETSRFWRTWIDSGNLPDHPWRAALMRSALTLKGLTYAPTGALLAASTTSLPELLGGTRNWDYRFTWIRDSAFAMRALSSLGFDIEADDFFAFMGDVLGPGHDGENSEHGHLRVLYPVDGAASPEEETLHHLTGYAGSRPVRSGNAASDQEQLDIYGEIVDCIFEHARARESLEEGAWPVVVQAVEMALKKWREPDRSIWEMRGAPQHFTYSKMMCWLAADRGARLAELRGDADRADAWHEAAEEIHADICENALSSRGVFTQAYGSAELDASLLVMSLVGFLPPDDERLRATVLAISEELSDGAFVYRYRAAAVDDGLGGEAEQSFTVCSFWLVSALTTIGELDLARSHCQKLIGAAGALGLYAEEIDPATGQHFGNLPQALTHLSLINAVLRIVRAEQRESSAGASAARSQTWWHAAGRQDRLRSVIPEPVSPESTEPTE
jgi:GH15 family glucan-1,4-alpha-glucosidase